ncbi:MAG: type II toxin-antitoxin system VapC family toxin [Actinomycetota bacterium]|nr:type II toxin-antitoxin system VapC family toxin [Actinomycetota bacterium]
MTVVVDANVAFEALSTTDGFRRLGDVELVAPPLLWSEVRSALHVAVWRGVLGDEAAKSAHAALDSGPVRERRHRSLGRVAWEIADELGWAKTYDAEYLALASLLAIPIVTFDGRVARAAGQLSIPTHALS